MAKCAHLAGLRAELKRCDRELKKIVQAIKDGVPGSVVKDDAIRHQARKEQIQQELQSADEPVMLMHPKLAAEYRRKVRGLIAALNKENGRAEAGELIRSLPHRADAGGRQARGRPRGRPRRHHGAGDRP